MNPRLRRLKALVVKESLQALRDPSCLLIAFVLPLILLFLYGYGVSLDARDVRLGIAVEGNGVQAQRLAGAFAASPWFAVERGTRPQLEQAMVAGHLRGVLVIPLDFDRKLERGEPAPVQLLTDGSETNTASYVQNYANGVLANWQAQRLRDRGLDPAAGPELQPRLWFNPEVRSRLSLVPGCLAIIMAIIGTLLTALVVAREWERGTMEALLSTPVGLLELIVGKLLPYFVLGLVSMLSSTAIAVELFDVPFRGSLPGLLLTSAAFLLAALAQGLLISSAARNQFVAAQGAVITAFLPAFLLSGFIFEIASMPLPIRIISSILPARYLVTNLQTLFLTGDVWPLLLRNVGIMLTLAALLFALVARKTVKRLD